MLEILSGMMYNAVDMPFFTLPSNLDQLYVFEYHSGAQARRTKPNLWPNSNSNISAHTSSRIQSSPMLLETMLMAIMPCISCSG